MIARLKKRLDRRLGEALFLRAHKDFVQDDMRRRTPVLMAAYALAGLVLLRNR